MEYNSERIMSEHGIRANTNRMEFVEYRNVSEAIHIYHLS